MNQYEKKQKDFLEVWIRSNLKTKNWNEFEQWLIGNNQKAKIVKKYGLHGKSSDANIERIISEIPKYRKNIRIFN